MEAQRKPAVPMFTPLVLATTSSLLPAAVAATTAPGTNAISIGATAVCGRGAVDAKTLAIVLSALRSLG
jgi:hypothetical protein